MTQDEKFMKRCLALAGRAAANGDVPVGAVVVCGGKAIAFAYNRREKDNDPTAHAETVALRRAGKKLGRRNLSGCTLYVTLEPCAMCAGAIVNARVDRVVFGAYDPRFGCCGSVMALCSDPRLNHRAEVTGGVMEEECAKILGDFFSALRKSKKEGRGEEEQAAAKK